MRKAAAKQGDTITATDTHIILVPAPPGQPVPTPVELPFTGVINGNLSRDVNIMGLPAAIQGSTAENIPPHTVPPSTPFQRPPTNKAQITMCASTVRINGKPAARNDDTAITCNDPADLPKGKVIATGTVMMG
jgi:uncharacterized Zn-binding protein involved in type VI secretion